jgi:carboxymethylenebutenolidase
MLGPAQILTERDAALDAYVARPATAPPRGAVVVFHELFGVTNHVRAVCDRLASTGFAAVAPNLHHRTDPALELPHDAAGRDRGFALLENLTRASVLEDADRALEAARALTAGPVALLGLSLGGHAAYYVATQRPGLAAAIVAYGGWIPTTDIPLSRPEPTVTLTAGISAPVLLLVAGADAAVDAAQSRAVEQALHHHAIDHEVVTYPAAQHGFLCEQRATYDAAASADAWSRIDALLDRSASATSVRTPTPVPPLGA